MSLRSVKPLKILGGLAFLGLLGLCAAVFPLVKGILKAHAEDPSIADDPASSAELLPGEPDTLRLPPDVAERLGIKTAEVVVAPPPEPLKLSGTLYLDPNRLSRVHSRFAGEVVEIGLTEGPSDNPSQSYPVTRPVRFGDRVQKDQLLAVVWSKDLGEKKSELVDALSRLRLDQETLKRLHELLQKGSIPERSVREAERNVESDAVAVARAERTLRSWRLSDADIETVRTEAEALRQKSQNPDKEVERAWARVEVRAPIDGVVLEKNVAIGDVVDTTQDLFKIADLSRLVVMAHAYEEELPTFEAIPPRERHWTIRVNSEREAGSCQGAFERIGHIIDPSQHTATVMGWVDNPNERLRVGQFITAAVDLPSPPDEVAVPTAAVLEQESEATVWVQVSADEPRYARRVVRPVRRGSEIVYVRSKLTPEQEAGGLKPIRPGERVVTAGALELAAALEEIKSSGKASP